MSQIYLVRDVLHEYILYYTSVILHYDLLRLHRFLSILVNPDCTDTSSACGSLDINNCYGDVSGAFAIICCATCRDNDERDTLGYGNYLMYMFHDVCQVYDYTDI